MWRFVISRVKWHHQHGLVEKGYLWRQMCWAHHPASSAPIVVLNKELPSCLLFPIPRMRWIEDYRVDMWSVWCCAWQPGSGSVTVRNITVGHVNSPDAKGRVRSLRPARSQAPPSARPPREAGSRAGLRRRVLTLNWGPRRLRVRAPSPSADGAGQAGQGCRESSERRSPISPSRQEDSDLHTPRPAEGAGDGARSPSPAPQSAGEAPAPQTSWPRPPAQRRPRRAHRPPRVRAAGGLARRLARRCEGTRAGAGGGHMRAGSAAGTRRSRSQQMSLGSSAAHFTRAALRPQAEQPVPVPALASTLPGLPRRSMGRSAVEQEAAAVGGWVSARARRGVRAWRAAGLSLAPRGATWWRAMGTERGCSRAESWAPRFRRRSCRLLIAASAPREAPGRPGSWPWSSSARSSKVSARGRGRRPLRARPASSAFLPGARRPTRPFVWHERTAAPGSRQDHLFPSASSSPLCAPGGDPEAHQDLAASRSCRLCPRASSSNCHTSLCKL